MQKITHRWEDAYQVAILETDDAVLQQRIEAAHRAIKARIDELAQDHQGTLEERLCLQIARARLDQRTSQRGPRRHVDTPQVSDSGPGAA